MRLKTLLAAASVMAIVASSAAKADTFEFKYLYESSLVTGYFDGTLVGDTTTGYANNASGIHLNVNGVAEQGPLYALYDTSTTINQTGHNYTKLISAQFAFNALNNDFNISTTDTLSGGDTGTWEGPTNIFIIDKLSTWTYAQLGPSSYGAVDPSAWTLDDMSVSGTGIAGYTGVAPTTIETAGGGIGATPELSTSLMLTLGVLGLGFMAWRRRESEAWNQA